MTMELDLSTPQRVHILAIGGAGMSAIATVLHAMGHHVSGCDATTSDALEQLRDLGIDAIVGHDDSHVQDIDVVVRSSAVSPRSDEVRAAEAAGIPVLTRSVALAAITRLRRTVSIAGTHGKTTTSSLLAVACNTLGLDPSYIVGGKIGGLAGGAAWGLSDLLIVEADESDGTFLDLDTDIAVVTNVEPDHLEQYGDYAGLLKAFDTFLDNVEGPDDRIVCVDDNGGFQIVGKHEALTYGTQDFARLVITEIASGSDGVRFGLLHQGQDLGLFHMPIPGTHNALNATAAIAVLLQLGVSADDARRGIASYRGVGRRFERRGERNGVVFIDDYAHLPAEVAAVLQAASSGEWKRVVGVFQPHRYSRTQALAAEFGSAFAQADVVVVTDVYAAGESPVAGVTGQLVVDAIARSSPGASVTYCPTRQDLVAHLSTTLTSGDLCLTMGAGDLTTLPDALLESL